jgi:hypothetical protein
MCEPYAALAQVTIDQDALIAYLAARPQSASQWNDWRRIGGRWYGFSWDEDLAEVFAKADRWLGASYRDAVSEVLRASEAPALGRCRYDEASRRFVFATLTYSENLNDFVIFFAAARGLSRYMRDPQSGFALVHNHLWGNRDHTIAVMGLGAGGHSYFLDSQADAPAHQQHLRDAIMVFDEIYQGYTRSTRAIPGSVSPTSTIRAASRLPHARRRSTSSRACAESGRDDRAMPSHRIVQWLCDADARDRDLLEQVR